jgi:hypothetical protein
MNINSHFGCWRTRSLVWFEIKALPQCSMWDSTDDSWWVWTCHVTTTTLITLLALSQGGQFTMWPSLQLCNVSDMISVITFHLSSKILNGLICSIVQLSTIKSQG